MRERRHCRSSFRKTTLLLSIVGLGVECHICSCVTVLVIGVTWLHSIVHSACCWYMSSSRPRRRHYVWFCCLVLLCETWVAICCPMCAKDDIVSHPSMTETLLSCFIAGRRHCHPFFHSYFLVQLFIVCGRICSKTVHVSYDYLVLIRDRLFLPSPVYSVWPVYCWPMFRWFCY